MPRRPHRDPASGRFVSQLHHVLEQQERRKEYQEWLRQRQDPDHPIWLESLAGVLDQIRRSTTAERFEEICSQIPDGITPKAQTEHACVALFRIQFYGDDPNAPDINVSL